VVGTQERDHLHLYIYIYIYIYILSRVRVTYRRGFGLDAWIYCTLCIHTVRDYRQYSALLLFYTLSSSQLHTH
jgi:hypothetical protein